MPRLVSRTQLLSQLTLTSTFFAFNGVDLVPVVRAEGDPVLLGMVPMSLLHSLANKTGDHSTRHDSLSARSV